LTMRSRIVENRRSERIRAFDDSAEEYEKWYCEEPGATICECEIKAVKPFVPQGLGVEVGVGTGVFASKLKTQVGVDAALASIKIAKKRGVEVVQGTAEALPFKDLCFDYVTSILVIEFLEDPESSFREAWRILKYGGSIITCFIPRNSDWGILYSKKKAEGHRVYRHANFYDSVQVKKMLQNAGFIVGRCLATLSQRPDSVTCAEEPCDEVGNHGFVYIRGKKTKYARAR